MKNWFEIKGFVKAKFKNENSLEQTIGYINSQLPSDSRVFRVPDVDSSIYRLYINIGTEIYDKSKPEQIRTLLESLNEYIIEPVVLATRFNDLDGDLLYLGPNHEATRNVSLADYALQRVLKAIPYLYIKQRKQVLKALEEK